MSLIAERMLHVVSPRMSGPDVRALQKRLRQLGYAPGAVDGVYGVATAAAVRAFQADQGLDADAIVGPRTRAALDDADPEDPATPRASLIGLAALEEARKHLGVKEHPAGSNRTPFGRWFGVDGVRWCNVFVSYCFGVGSGYTICEGLAGAGVYPRGCAYVPTTEAWLRASGMWVGRAAPEPGDIVIYDFDGGEADHVGIVERDCGDGEFVAIEGNTGSGADADGGAVQRRRRNVRQTHGFGRVR